MIQRIQSIYLFLAAVLVAIAAFVPLVDFELAESSAVYVARLSAFSWETIDVNGVVANPEYFYSLGIFVIITAILNFVTIFLFSKRKLQIKFTHYAFILKIALFVVVGYFSFTVHELPVQSTTPKIGLLFIIVSMVFDWLAVKAIRKDEALVRSIDRIR